MTRTVKKILLTELYNFCSVFYGIKMIISMHGTMVLLHTFTVHSRARAVDVHVYKILKESNNKFTTVY